MALFETTVVVPAADKRLKGTRREIWVRVLANEMVNWPQVKESLGEEEQALIQSCYGHRGQGTPVDFYPSFNPESEDAEEAYWKYEDWFVFEVEANKPLEGMTL